MVAGTGTGGSTALRNAQSHLDLAEERAALDRLDIRSFIASDNRQLVSVRLLELAKARIQFEADESATVDDRSRRLQEIDRKIAEIDNPSNSTAN